MFKINAKLLEVFGFCASFTPVANECFHSPQRKPHRAPQECCPGAQKQLLDSLQLHSDMLCPASTTIVTTMLQKRMKKFMLCFSGRVFNIKSGHDHQCFKTVVSSTTCQSQVTDFAKHFQQQKDTSDR